MLCCVRFLALNKLLSFGSEYHLNSLALSLNYNQYYGNQTNLS